MRDCVASASPCKIGHVPSEMSVPWISAAIWSVRRPKRARRRTPTSALRNASFDDAYSIFALILDVSGIESSERCNEDQRTHPGQEDYLAADAGISLRELLRGSARSMRDRRTKS